MACEIVREDPINKCWMKEAEQGKAQGEVQYGFTYLMYAVDQVQFVEHTTLLVLSPWPEHQERKKEE